MYSLNLLSCLIILFLGSIYVLTKPLSIGSRVPSTHNEIFLDEIALALVENFEESESSVFEEEDSEHGIGSRDGSFT